MGQPGRDQGHETGYDRDHSEPGRLGQERAGRGPGQGGGGLAGQEDGADPA
jgi:hypothetical protein